MKKRIFIMLLIFTLLLGAFSINAFAEDTEAEAQYLIKSFEFKDGDNITLTGFVDSAEVCEFKLDGSFISNGESFTQIEFKLHEFGGVYYYTSDGTQIQAYTYFRNTLTEEYRSVVFDGYLSVNEIVYSFLVDNTLSLEAEVIEPHTHSYTSSIIAPTCTEKGYTSYTCECGDTYTDTEVSALGHSYSSVVTSPSCSDTGFTTHTCTVCGDNYTDTETAALGHNYSSVTTPSTCTVKGYNTYTCSACGDSYIGESLDLIPHNYVSVVTPPTVTKKGFTTHTCSMCGDNYIDSYVDELPSSEDTIISVWDEIFNDFISLFGSAQTVFYDGKSITFLGALVLLALGLGLAFLLISVIVNFLRSRG